MTENKRFIGRLPGRPGIELAPTLIMDGPAVVWSHTGERDIAGPGDFKIFDENPGIVQRRAASIPGRLENLRQQ